MGTEKFGMDFELPRGANPLLGNCCILENRLDD
jgi:hypothetical protein